MRLCLFVCLLVSAASVSAQSKIDQLTSDLLRLKSVPAVPENTVVDYFRSSAPAHRDFYANFRNRHRDQADIMQQFLADAISGYENSRQSWDFAFTLTSALAGKDLSEETLMPLTTSLARAFESAFACRNTGRSLRDSDDFRASEGAFSIALTDLGVSGDATRLVLRTLRTTGSMMAGFRIIGTRNL